jgi:hypothetical protein
MRRYDSNDRAGDRLVRSHSFLPAVYLDTPCYRQPTTGGAEYLVIPNTRLLRNVEIDASRKTPRKVSIDDVMVFISANVILTNNWLSRHGSGVRSVEIVLRDRLAALKMILIGFRVLRLPPSISCAFVIFLQVWNAALANDKVVEYGDIGCRPLKHATLKIDPDDKLEKFPANVVEAISQYRRITTERGLQHSKSIFLLNPEGTDWPKLENALIFFILPEEECVKWCIGTAIIQERVLYGSQVASINILSFRYNKAFGLDETAPFNFSVSGNKAHYSQTSSRILFYDESGGHILSFMHLTAVKKWVGGTAFKKSTTASPNGTLVKIETGKQFLGASHPRSPFEERLGQCLLNAG